MKITRFFTLDDEFFSYVEQRSEIVEKIGRIGIWTLLFLTAWELVPYLGIELPEVIKTFLL